MDCTKTHFDPYFIDDGESSCDNAMCGTIVGESYNFSASWKHIDCKRCIKQKDKLNKVVEETEKTIINQMDSFVKFCNNREGN